MIDQNTATLIAMKRSNEEDEIIGHIDSRPVEIAGIAEVCVQLNYNLNQI